ncbi:S41 family peptidase [uncultured Clostridium sp.]|uniref:S41 family peptidase n=1 Tax=uncultured Clostridium sp. TaxID=59620 RepID=UPI00262708F4|nr:S41 family peptidase [uncultured Clostridium sp.]
MRERENKASYERRGYTKNWKVILMVIGFSVLSILVGNRLTAKGLMPITSNLDVQGSFKEIKDIEKYSKLFSIRDQIYRYYDGEINDDKLLEGAIKGMSMGLGDPYTYYMNKEEFEGFMEQNSGEYMGVGIRMGTADKNLLVVESLEGGPAYAAGIKAGDILKAINGTSVTVADMEKTASMLKGKKKENIKLTVQRDGKELNIDVMRDVVKTINVKGYMMDEEVGYIAVKAFEENVAKDFTAKLEELQNKGMQGLVLDLRGNPGGYMSECVGLASNFIDKGEPIVTTIDKYGEKEKNLSKGGIAKDLPLVVLIDGNSASASEVVSGAIRDYGVGTLIGETSFGKGIVQIPVSQPDGSALKITISKYYTPNGENIHGTGIKPDIEVEYPEELKNKPYNRAEDPQLEKAMEVMKDKIK